jgi:Ca2+-binding RTX toxin-like protein
MAIIVGTKHDNVIDGTNSADTIYARYGVDMVKGHGGDDIIYGDANRVTGGVEILRGGLGHDKIYGNDGNDELYGDQGNDLLKGDNGDDKLYGGSGNDMLEGGSGNDQLKGGTGNDVYTFLRGSQQDVVIDDGGVFDTVRLQTGVNKTQIGFFRDGNNLQIGYAGSTDVFTIRRFTGWRQSPTSGA